MDWTVANIIAQSVIALAAVTGIFLSILTIRNTSAAIKVSTDSLELMKEQMNRSFMPLMKVTSQTLLSSIFVVSHYSYKQDEHIESNFECSMINVGSGAAMNVLLEEIGRAHV